MNNYISPSDLRELLDYNPKTGIFTWKHRSPDDVSSFGRTKEQESSRWNKAFAGTEAFASTDRNGYRKSKIKGHYYLGHRVAWAMQYGEWPVGQIDHINRIRSDNRIENLRCVDGSTNCKNRSPVVGRGKVYGVSWRKKQSRWQASIGHKGKNIYLGVFMDYDDAVKARKEAESRYGFHPNHGVVTNATEGQP